MISDLTDWPSDARTAAQQHAEAWAEHFAGQEERPLGDLLPELAAVTEAQKTHERELLARENVVGVAAGVKVKKGAPTGEPAGSRGGQSSWQLHSRRGTGRGHQRPGRGYGASLIARRTR
jgi:hypothetical protein